ncbi:MAG: A/G-specific adenine glycosylase [Cytophagales bacterium]|nr:A/G-specific adenine glycosylase [Armatimonadota bacterium]
MIHLPVSVGASDSQRDQQFASLLLPWYEGGKRDLPWRQTRDPYAIWVSEMMLQQTQVATVIPYWTRWMERFPTVAHLAEAPLDAVLAQWQGLGYYARARNLHKAAKAIAEGHEGIFPTDFESVLALPGIGKYTAGAVCSIAFGQDAAIVDANVIRVLCRVYGLEGDPKSLSVRNRLWALAQSLIPPGQAREFNQAMMELGALICEPKPRCGECPVREICAASATGTPASFPQFAPKPAFTRQIDVSALIFHPDGDGRVLLIRRPEDGLWGGLWETPRVTATEQETVSGAAARAAWEAAGAVVRATGESMATVKHGVTTRKITLVGVRCDLATDGDPEALLPGPNPRAWATAEELGSRYPLSTPQTKLLRQALARESQLSLFS